MIQVPRLHVVTNDAILETGAFADRAADLLSGTGTPIALHLRSRSISTRDLCHLAERLLGFVGDSVLIINDRADVAAAVGAHGVHLPESGISVQEARSVIGRERLAGRSTHELADAAGAIDAGADYSFLGNVWRTSSHPDRPGIGLPERLSGPGPVLAIGGVTEARVPDLLRAGFHGVAVISAVWETRNPVSAANRFLVSLEL